MSPFCRYYILGFFLLSSSSFWRWDVAEGNLSFSMANFGKVSDSDSQVALLGNAELVNKTMSVRISGSGRLICKEPFSLITNLIAFSTHIAFSLSSGDRGFDFVMLPHAFPEEGFANPSRKNGSFAVEFDVFEDGRYGGVDIESRASFFRRQPSNVSVSSVKLKLRSGEKLQAWINYEASGKRLEISLSKNGGNSKEFYIPLISYPIDFSSIWKQQQILIGLVSSSTSAAEIYSWSFESRNLENTSHSQPMNTENFKGMSKEVGNENKNKSEDDCGSRIVAALVFGIACGAMGGLFLVFLWRLFAGKRRLVVPEVVDGSSIEKADEKTMTMMMMKK